MSIKTDFISGSAPWRKTFIKRHGELETKLTKPPYHVTSYRELSKDLTELHSKLKEHAKQGHALLRGTLRQPLDNESRAGKIDKKAKTKLLILDVDGTTCTDDPVEFINRFLGFGDVDMIVTYTSSFGIKPGMRANIIIELSTETTFRDLNNLLWWRQLQNPDLRDEITLDVSGSLLLPTIDTASCVPAQVFTIAPPNCTPKTLDPFIDNPDARYAFHPGKEPTLGILDLMPPSLDDLAKEKAKLLTLLRTMSGRTRKAPEVSSYLDRRTGEEWNLVEDPEPAMVTRIIDQGDFVRLDLNGGDSQSHWHPADSLDWVYSFKNYIKYPMQKLVPEYYQAKVEQQKTTKVEAAETMKHEIDKGGEFPFIAINADTEDYLCAMISKSTTWEDVQSFTKVRSVESWLDSNSATAPYTNVPPLYKVVFDPDRPFFDPTTNTINRFTAPQEVTFKDRDKTLEELNPQVRRLLLHVMAGDEIMLETFLDWVAFLYQKRTAPQSAWLLHGCQGTGKDMTFLLLQKVLGHRYCRSVMPNSLNEPYNGWAEDANLIFVNEIDSRVFKGSNLSAKLNDYITADELVIRRMRTDGYTVKNLTGYIFASNRSDAVELPPGDRRFHVPPRQEIPLIKVMSEEDIRSVAYIDEVDIGKLRHWFSLREYNESRLRRPGTTEAKRVLADSAQPAATRLVGHLRDGRWATILADMESYEGMFNEHGNSGSALLLEGFFKDFVDGVETDRKNIVITLKELRALFSCVCDPKLADMAPGKFRQYMLHNHMFEVTETVVRKRWDKSRRGVMVPMPESESAYIVNGLIELGFLSDTKAPKLEVVK